jgi:hypothetical protein
MRPVINTAVFSVSGGKLAQRGPFLKYAVNREGVMGSARAIVDRALETIV